MGNESVQRLGILGGTFDPPHQGHIDMACYIRDALDLDKVLLIPTGDPPYKTTKALAKERYEMVNLTVSQYEKIESSGIEVFRSGVSYTIKTIDILAQEYPNAKLYFIIGGDTVESLSSWYQIEKIFQLSEIVIVSRKGFVCLQEKIEILEKLYHFKPIVLTKFVVDISSTKIRELIKNNLSITGLVKPSVEEYIRKQALYKK